MLIWQDAAMDTLIERVLRAVSSLSLRASRSSCRSDWTHVPRPVCEIRGFRNPCGHESFTTDSLSCSHR